MRKRAEDYEAKKTALRRGAARVMSERAFDSASWASVASEAGASQGAIQYYDAKQMQREAFAEMAGRMVLSEVARVLTRAEGVALSSCNAGNEAA